MQVLGAVLEEEREERERGGNGPRRINTGSLAKSAMGQARPLVLEFSRSPSLVQGTTSEIFRLHRSNTTFAKFLPEECEVYSGISLISSAACRESRV